MEEEFPINQRNTPGQEIWSDKWRILKSAMILTGKFPYNEINPITLEKLCKLVGFIDVQWTAHVDFYRDVKVLNFFQKRLDILLSQLNNQSLRSGFSELSMDLFNRASQSHDCVMETPFYQLSAKK